MATALSDLLIVQWVVDWFTLVAAVPMGVEAARLGLLLVI
jgi:hypothetical protein